ncbi:hypothetical protein [Roseobacter sp. SK209-2-6]|uniref:hypothetical protein n=1 Tax=Roseobacter sp. SK209-2-6 TaxID=388739 RepID=UPI00055F4F7F|nr:hypothetical protein [Roseobacter sp. SK209-2-6]
MASRSTEKFRSESMLLALTSGLPRLKVAADFGIGFPTLNRWIHQDNLNPEKPTVQSNHDREIAGLLKNNHMLRAEWEMLKRPPSSLR